MLGCVTVLYVMKHSDNGVAVHAQSCGGVLSKVVKNKDGLGAFEMWCCDRCPYVGRGRKVDIEDKDS